MKPKILIMYATYGIGHKKIAQYIEEYFNDHGEYEIKSIDILKYSTPVLGRLSQKTFEKINFSVPYIWDFLYHSFNHRFSAVPTEKMSIGIFKNKRMKKEIVDFNPDLIISTHFFASSLIADYKKKDLIKSKLITIVTDYEAHEFWLKNIREEDALIVGNSYERKELIRNRINRFKIKDYGIPLSDAFNEANYDVNKTIHEYRLDPNKKTILFLGSRGKILIPYLELLIKEKLDINLIVVSGNNQLLRDKVNEYKRIYDNKDVVVLGFINNIPELLNISSLVVTKPGGASVTECLYFNKPMLFVGKPVGQEKANYKFLEKMGCGKRTKTPIIMMQYINELLNNENKLSKMSERAKKVSKKDAMKKLFKLSNRLLDDFKNDKC